MLEFLLFATAAGLIAVYFHKRSAARKACGQLREDIQDAVALLARTKDARSRGQRRFDHANGFLKSAEAALEKRDWDKALELCDLGQSMLALAVEAIPQDKAA